VPTGTATATATGIPDRHRDRDRDRHADRHRHPDRDRGRHRDADRDDLRRGRCVRRRGGHGTARLRRPGERRDPRLLPERRHDLQWRRHQHPTPPSKRSTTPFATAAPTRPPCTPPDTASSSRWIRWSDASKASCRAETASLGSRAFGGPQGAALTEADDAARACLTNAHQDTSALVDTLVTVYHDCLAVERNGGTCNVARDGKPRPMRISSRRRSPSAPPARRCPPSSPSTHRPSQPAPPLRPAASPPSRTRHRHR
jgi:hypothetical protein